MEGATEYRDSWRGLRILVPSGWLVRRSGPGLFLHDPAGERVIIIQPRPGTTAVESLEAELLAWLKRLDAGAELTHEPDGPAETRACTARLQVRPDGVTIGVFALEIRPGGGLISGFLAPALTYEVDSRSAMEALATIEPFPALSRGLWHEPAERAGSALIPRGWRVEGHVNRNNPAGMAATRFEVWADDTMGVVADTGSRLFLEPGLLNGILSSLAHGAVSQGKFVDASHFAETHLLPILRREAADATVEEIIPRPDLVPLAVAQEAASTGTSARDYLAGQPSGADVLFCFHAGGLQVRQLARLVTMRLPASLTRDLPLWTASAAYSYRAPMDRFAEWEPVLEGVGQSFMLDREWERKEQRRVARQARNLLRPSRSTALADPLLAEAERLVCERTGQRLGAHERPFSPCAGSEVAQGEAACPVSSLYEGPIWRKVRT